VSGYCGIHLSLNRLGVCIVIKRSRRCSLQQSAIDSNGCHNDGCEGDQVEFPASCSCGVQACSKKPILLSIRVSGLVLRLQEPSGESIEMFCGEVQVELENDTGKKKMLR
jgi:hypothetical protein